MSSLISADQMAEWRALHGEGMVSAVGEYTPEEFWRALDAIDALAADNKRLQAECQMLRGLTPEPPPRPPEGEGLPRYGLRWNGPGQPLSVPMDDGYWTPWHLAATAVVMPDTDCEWCAGAGHDSYGDKCAHCIKPARGVPEGKEFSQFLSAVMDAAGLVRHGRQSKELSEYLGSKCMEYMLSATPAQPDQCAHDLTMVKAGEA